MSPKFIDNVDIIEQHSKRTHTQKIRSTPITIIQPPLITPHTIDTPTSNNTSSINDDRNNPIGLLHPDKTKLPHIPSELNILHHITKVTYAIHSLMDQTFHLQVLIILFLNSCLIQSYLHYKTILLCLLTL